MADLEILSNPESWAIFEDKKMSLPPTYHELEEACSKTYNMKPQRHHINEHLNILPPFFNSMSSSSNIPEPNALSKTYTNTYRSEGDKKKLEIHIEFANNGTFLQGDYIEGKFFISNKSETAIPFILCSVALVGSIETGYKSEMRSKHYSIQTFLSEIDHNANLKLKDIHNKYTVPLRGDNKRCIMPFTTYCSSFSFKIPNSLLSCVCSSHEMILHYNLLPSFNLKKSIGVHSYPIKNKYNCTGFKGAIDMNITYNIEVSVIDKLTDYKESISDDPNILISKEKRELLIVPRTDILYPITDSSYSRSEYGNLVKEIKKIISSNVAAFTPKENSILKKGKLKQNNCGDINNETQLPFEKVPSLHTFVKPLFYWYGSSKGEIKVQVPNRLTYFDISSADFYFFSDENVIRTPYLCIPIEFQIAGHFGLESSSIEKVSSELIGLTYLSKHSHIPMCIGHDLLFENKVIHEMKDFNPIEEIIKKPLLPLLNKIMATKLRPSEYSLIADLQCLVNLIYEYKSFKILEENSGTVYWKPEEKKNSIDKKTIINVYISGSTIRNIFQNSELDQDFQCCQGGRLYYVKSCIKLHHLGSFFINIPITFRNVINIYNIVEDGDLFMRRK